MISVFVPLGLLVVLSVLMEIELAHFFLSRRVFFTDFSIIGLKLIKEPVPIRARILSLSRPIYCHIPKVSITILYFVKFLFVILRLFNRICYLTHPFSHCSYIYCTPYFPLTNLLYAFT